MSEQGRVWSGSRVSHEQARDSAQRLINSHFRQEPHARASIPARPEYDDDLIICRYIEQQSRLEAERPDLHDTALQMVEVHEAILSQGAHGPGSPQQITHWATHGLLKKALGLPEERQPELALEALRKIVGGKISAEQGAVIHRLRDILRRLVESNGADYEAWQSAKAALQEEAL